jgi:cobalt-precorrin-5B (C1)-methyltransferase
MKRKRLRAGFTTGTAAAAAAKGAVLAILEDHPPATVEVELLTGERIAIPIHSCRRCEDGSAVCTVIKDAGDDPDVTHGAEIGARVRILLSAAAVTAPPAVFISGGEGVGRITKPGLELPPGEPAINPGPRRMITTAVTEALCVHGKTGGVAIEVFVPKGEEIARKTLNARLGILGGISILGTTGIVRPMSHEAFTATIDAGLSVARACSLKRVVLTTGRRSERFAQARWPDLESEAYVQIGDFFQEGLARCAAKRFETATLAVFFGKALKMAEGLVHTHAARAQLTLSALANWAGATAADAALPGKILAANTAREAFGYLHPDHPEVIAEVGRRIVAAAAHFSGSGLKIQSVIFDYEGTVVFDSERQC